MGIYINKGNEGFRRALNGEYVDKTGMIEVINKTLDTERSLTCVTRSRRFGKSMAADMLCAYYDKSCDSRHLFDGLAAQQVASFDKHLNKYPVISLDITDFITKYKDNLEIISLLQKDVTEDLLSFYPNIPLGERDDLMDVICKINAKTGEKFICIIDEWDALLREYGNNEKIEGDYVKLLRRLFKGSCSKSVFAGVYMTGILPIKKFNTQSALNNFEEYSVIDPADLAGYFGFTPQEVEALANKYGRDVAELKKWYDGYQIGSEPSIFNPYSIIKAVQRGKYTSYWQKTGAYDSVSTYIQMNYEGLKDDIISMLAGGRCPVNTTRFSNDMNEVSSKDDVFTVLIHLGYLSYDEEEQECYIPNKEVRMEMVNAVSSCQWHVAKALEESKKLLKATLEGNEEAVAKGIELAHDSNTSILSYNDENSLACVLSIAYYHAMNDYIIHRELATGKGFADLVFIPRRNVDKPPMVVELKYNKDADAAIDQIRRKEYQGKVLEYLDSRPLAFADGQMQRDGEGLSSWSASTTTSRARRTPAASRRTRRNDEQRDTGTFIPDAISQPKKHAAYFLKTRSVIFERTLRDFIFHATWKNPQRSVAKFETQRC